MKVLGLTVMSAVACLFLSACGASSSAACTSLKPQCTACTNSISAAACNVMVTNGNDAQCQATLDAKTYAAASAACPTLVPACAELFSKCASCTDATKKSTCDGATDSNQEANCSAQLPTPCQ